MTQQIDEAAIVALGSNLPGVYAASTDLLEAALEQFQAEGLVLLRRSRWWRSAAWPDPDLPDYLNGLAIVETALGPRATLAALLAIEARFGRTRGAANAARTLDLDLIAHGRRIIREPDLVLPHPRAAERRFVMGPLAEIAPEWRHPETGATAAALARTARIGQDAVPV